jgi:hypothetical protein
MPHARYQFTAAAVRVVHRWMQAKLHTPTWPQPATAHHARDQFPHDQPTASELQQWCAQYLAASQWAQLQAVIRAARREQRTLSETLERHLAPMPATLAPQATPPPSTTDTQRGRPVATAPTKQGSAFIATKKGVCYLTVKVGRHHFPLMRIRNYTIDAQDKRNMHRLHPAVSSTLAYRACTPLREPFYGVFEPHTWWVYVNDPDNTAGVGAILARER